MYEIVSESSQTDIVVTALEKEDEREPKVILLQAM
jgi:hypothetical protein